VINKLTILERILDDKTKVIYKVHNNLMKSLDFYENLAGTDLQDYIQNEK